MFYEGRCHICSKDLYWNPVKVGGSLKIIKNFEYCPACLRAVCPDCLERHFISTHGVRP